MKVDAVTVFLLVGLIRLHTKVSEGYKVVNWLIVWETVLDLPCRTETSPAFPTKHTERIAQVARTRLVLCPATKVPTYPVTTPFVFGLLTDVLVSNSVTDSEHHQKERI